MRIARKRAVMLVLAFARWVSATGKIMDAVSKLLSNILWLVSSDGQETHCTTGHADCKRGPVSLKLAVNSGLFTIHQIDIPYH